MRNGESERFGKSGSVAAHDCGAENMAGGVGVNFNESGGIIKLVEGSEFDNVMFGLLVASEKILFVEADSGD